MTERERANFLELKRHIIYEVQHGKCYFCDAPATELAHRISQSKPNLRKYGKGIVHHPRNLLGTCSRCNHLALIDNRPLQVAQLVHEIVKDITGV